jgi:hypothetical protein
MRKLAKMSLGFAVFCFRQIYGIVKQVRLSQKPALCALLLKRKSYRKRKCIGHKIDVGNNV